MSEEKKDKIARCEINTLTIDLATKTLSFTATLTGKIKSGTSWSIERARTVVKGKGVPISEFLSRVLIGWFWVRKVQDVLRKGSAREAQTALDKGYDWTEETSTTRGASKASPEEQVMKGLAAMTPEQRAK